MTYTGGTWADARAASEGGGGVYLGLEIDVRDPDASLPGTSPWKRTTTLYFSDNATIRSTYAGDNFNTEGDTGISIAGGPTGRHASCQASDGTLWTVQSGRWLYRYSGGSWSQVAELTGDGASGWYTSIPNVCADDSGNVMVVYGQSAGSGTDGIYAELYNSSGTQIDGPDLIQTENDGTWSIFTNNRVALRHAGGGDFAFACLVFEIGSGTPRDGVVRYRTYDAGTATWGSSTDLTQQSTTNVANDINHMDMAIDSSGELHFVVGRENNPDGIWYTDATTDTWELVYDATGEHDVDVRIEIDSNERPHCVFDWDDGTNATRVHHAYLSNGSWVDAEVDGVESSAGDRYVDTVYVNGALSAVYRAPDGSGDWYVWKRSWDDGWGDPVQVSTTAGASNTTPITLAIARPYGTTTSNFCILWGEDTDANGTADETWWNCAGSEVVRYSPNVVDWGAISVQGDFGGSLQTVADVQVRLSNAPTYYQEAGSDIGGSIVALNPEPDMENLRMSELLRLWQFDNARARIVALYVAGFKTEIDDPDSHGQRQVLYRGRVNRAKVTGDTVLFDMTLDTEQQGSEVKGRSLGDSIDASVRDSFAPIVYGNLGFSYEPAGAVAFTPGTSGPEILHACGVRPILAPAYLLDKESGSEQYSRYIWHDEDNPNNINMIGSSSITKTGAGLSNTAVLSHRNGLVSDILFTTGAATDGEAQFDWDGTPPDGLYVKTNRYIQARVYCRATEFEFGESNLTDPSNVTDGTHETYGVWDLSSTGNEFSMRLPTPGNIGTIISPANIQVYIAWSSANSTVGASSAITYGLANTASGTGGYITSSTVATNAMNVGLEQHTLASSDFAYDDGVMNWQWSYDDAGTIKDVFFKAHCSTANSGDNLAIVAVGVRVLYLAAPWIGEDLRKYVRNRHRTAFGRLFDEDPNDKFGFLLSGTDYLRSTVSMFSGFEVNQQDTNDGDITGVADAALTRPAHICHHLILAYGRGVTAGNIVTASSTFGSFADAYSDMNSWVSTYVTGGTTWEQIAVIDGSRINTLDAALNTITRQTPMTVQQSHTDGDYYATVVYPGSSIPTRLRFQDSGGTAVVFHPAEVTHPDASDRYKDYAIWNFETGYEATQLSTDIRLRFKSYAPTGALTQEVYANPDEQKTWNQTSGAYATASSGTLVTACANAESILGFRRPELVIDAPDIADRSTATAFLFYLVSIATTRRVYVRFLCGPEASTLLVGQYIKISNDMNLSCPLPKYGADDWEDVSFIVKEVTITAPGGSPVVEVYAEEHVSL